MLAPIMLFLDPIYIIFSLRYLDLLQFNYDETDSSQVVKLSERLETKRLEQCVVDF